MKINVLQNKKLDLETIRKFFIEADPVITESWPQIKSVDDIPAVIEGEYGPELIAKVAELKDQNETLIKLTEEISQVIDEPWGAIKEINIYIGACPIAPRFLDTNSFLLPYYYKVDILLNWSAHEMIHFLYFKKWSKLFPQNKPENFEYPDPAWVLSEILVAIIGNDQRIKDIVRNDFNIYDHWQKMKFGGKKLTEIFQPIYDKKKSFNDFLENSWEKYQELDKKYNLTKKLT